MKTKIIILTSLAAANFLSSCTTVQPTVQTPTPVTTTQQTTTSAVEPYTGTTYKKTTTTTNY